MLKISAQTVSAGKTLERVIVLARKGIVHNFKHLNLLSDADVERLHDGTLKVLKRKGTKICDQKALQLLADHGCEVDFNEQTAKFPENLVMDCIDKAPGKYEVKARNPENNLLMEAGKVTYFTQSPNMNILDIETNESRCPTKKEFYDFIKICDALDTVDWQTCFPFYGFEDIPACMANLESNACKIRMSDKVSQEGTYDINYKFTFEMAKAMDQEIMQLLNPMSPSTYYKEHVDLLFYYAENDIPFCIGSGPLIGVSSPATVTGGVIMNNADALAGIVLAQLIRPGTRIHGTGMIMQANMRSLSPLFGDVGTFMADSLYNQMWRYYNIPCNSTSSAWTNSKWIDYQSGYEMAIATMLNALTGATNILFHGGLTAELVGSPLKACIDDDVAGLVKRYLQGVEVSEDTMAIDLIEKVGHIPGSFIAEDHTLDWFKSDTYETKVADRLSIDQWRREGKKTIIQRGQERMEEILETHKINPLTEKQEETIENILNEARSYYRKNGLISNEEWKAYEATFKDAQQNRY